MCWGVLCVISGGGGGGVDLLIATVPCLLFSTSDQSNIIYLFFNLNGGKSLDRDSIEV